VAWQVLELWGILPPEFTKIEQSIYILLVGSFAILLHLFPFVHQSLTPLGKIA
jgi:hypothetical protein